MTKSKPVNHEILVTKYSKSLTLASQVLVSLTHSKLRRFQGYMTSGEREIYVNIQGGQRDSQSFVSLPSL